MPQVILTAKTMIQGADIYEIPLIVTEQYPKALLHTVSELDISRAKVFEKTRFSMCTNEFLSHLDAQKRKACVIFGVEAHVCVQQTALDLLSRGYTVHVLADGVSSQRAADRETALNRLRQSGAFITSVESVLFELLRSKDAAEFKQISQLAKSHGDAIRALQQGPGGSLRM
eukprot:gnl/TRDRNA2_/TRDRNA2_83364_c0_seq1.p1 gnl/TRDRNA2_/TRDRNA2_83364_c0~~gnl/TRDRNA2_/TRDRNA2_83364_c0_seq1.p1  ORF type:complete len:190 (-),score=38.27 gnl/TRDRNA2_/TRDRNA2_83364_c0_seq1:38-553(-)